MDDGVMTELTVSGFLFDMDGTLADSTHAVESVWAEMCERLGIDLQAVMAVSHGRQARATLADFAPDLAGDELEDVVAWMAHEEEVRLDQVVEIPGAAAVMSTLIAQGAPVALVTSAHLALAEARMGAAGVPMPPVVVTAESVSRSKPDPEGYLLGAELLGLPATDCVGFEDADAGVAAVLGSGASLVVVGSLSASSAGIRIADYTGVTVGRDGDKWTLTFP